MIRRINAVLLLGLVAYARKLLNGMLIVFIPAMMMFPLVMIVQIQKRMDTAVKRSASPPGVVMR